MLLFLLLLDVLTCSSLLTNMHRTFWLIKQQWKHDSAFPKVLSSTCSLLTVFFFLGVIFQPQCFNYQLWRWFLRGHLQLTLASNSSPTSRKWLMTWITYYYLILGIGTKFPSFFQTDVGSLTYRFLLIGHESPNNSI